MDELTKDQRIALMKRGFKFLGENGYVKLDEMSGVLGVTKSYVSKIRSHPHLMSDAVLWRLTMFFAEYGLVFYAPETKIMSHQVKQKITVDVESTVTLDAQGNVVSHVIK